MANRASGLWGLALGLFLTLLSPLSVSSLEGKLREKSEPSLEELEQRLNNFSEKKDTLQELMLEFKGEQPPV